MHAPPSAQLIGTAIQTIGGRRITQPCRGTFQDDLPHSDFRFNILFVEHADDFPIHSHQYCELAIVQAGAALHITPQETYAIGPSDVFVIHSGQSHGFENVKRLRLCNIQFDPVRLLPSDSDLEQMMGYHALFDLEPRCRQDDRFRPRFRIDPINLRSIDELLEKIDLEFHSGTEGSRPMIRGAFLQLVSLLSRLYTQKRHNSPAPLARMANVAAHVRRHFSQHLPVKRLARIAHLSTSQFQRAFRKHYGTSAARFVLQVRMEAACRLLKDPSLDIAAIGQTCGFSSPALFATRFRQTLGLTPSAYRKKISESIAQISAVSTRPASGDHS